MRLYGAGEPPIRVESMAFSWPHKISIKFLESSVYAYLQVICGAENALDANKVVTAARPEYWIFARMCRFWLDSRLKKVYIDYCGGEYA